MPSSTTDTSVLITITLGNGKEVKPFNSVTITQSIVQHHSFEVRCYHEVFEKPDADVITSTQNMVGQLINITFKKTKGSVENTFKGIITEIGMVQGDGLNHEIVLKGFGKTIALESGPHLKVYLQKSIRDIVSELAGKCQLNVKGSPKTTKHFDYCAQFNESNFQFLRRLAAIHGEWFYYDGVDLVFGEPGTIPTIKLRYMQDLMTLSTGMGIVPLQFSTYGFNSGNADEQPKIYKSNKAFEPGDSYGRAMNTASKNVYAEKVKSSPRHLFNTQPGLDAYTQSYVNALGAGMVHVQASGDNPEVTIGVVAEISTEKGDTYGKYFITSVTHHADGMGNYSNNFSGIPSTVKTLPNPYIHKPNADFEIAKVVDNVDPKKWARVKVRFNWMEDNETTYWIPTTQLYGGGSNFKNRGTVFIPEIDDEVIVGFERGDCDKPYVSQSLMNTKAVETGANDNSKNLKKIISTRDTRITFRDKGDGSDPVGIAMMVYAGANTAKSKLILSDESGKTTSMLTAIDELTFMTNGDEVKIVMNKDGSIKVTGKNITLDATDTITLKGKEIKMEATSNISAKANQNIKFEAMSNIEIKATQKFSATANTGVSIKSSMNTEIEGSIQVKVSGAMAELAGSGMTTIKGGVVMIN